MLRYLVGCLVAALVASPAVARLKVAAPSSIAERMAVADVVVTGKVTAIEKDEVELESYPGSPQKVSYKVAVVKIETTYGGAKNETHVKIAFQPAAAATGRPGRQGTPAFDFKEDAEGLFFLKKAAGGVYVYDYATAPVDAKAETYKANLEVVKKATAVYAEPVKSLQAKEAADRYFAAAVLALKYRTARTGAKLEAVPADESKLILQAIQDADWAKGDEGVPPPYQTFVRLGATAADGWKPAAFNGNGDFNTHMKAEFETWRQGDGAKFQVKKYVAK